MSSTRLIFAVSSYPSPYHKKVDLTSWLSRVEVINDEDTTVAKAVKTCLPQIAAAIDMIVPRIANGGRVIYTGAGTSGR